MVRTPIRQDIRRRLKRMQHEEVGILGDGKGNVSAGSSKYYVRFSAGADATGAMAYGAPIAVFYSGQMNVVAAEGSEVLVYFDTHLGDLAIKGTSPAYYRNTGLDSKISNILEPVYHTAVFLRDVVRWMARPLGSTATGAAQTVTIRENPFFVDDYYVLWQYEGTTRASDKVDLSTYIPVPGYHCIVCIWLDAYTQTYEVTSSTHQALATALDSNDLAEAFAARSHNELVPLLSLRLHDAQASITINDVIGNRDDLTGDMRQFVNAPRVYGFPVRIESSKPAILRGTHQQVVNVLTIEGEFTCEGDMTIL